MHFVAYPDRGTKKKLISYVINLNIDRMFEQRLVGTMVCVLYEAFRPLNSFLIFITVNQLAY